MRSLHFFADESGNSGVNYLDQDQPIYAVAGFLVEPEDLDDARSVVKRALAGSQMKELKGAKMIRRRSGRRTALQIVDGVGQRAIPIASLVEKRFALGARIADAFLDFGTNPRAGVRFREDNELARSAAHVFSNLPQHVLAVANEYMGTPTDANGRRCCQAVAAALRDEEKNWLASVVEGALGGDLSAEDRPGLSSNVAGFANIMAMLQPLAEVVGARIRVVHDEQLEFAESFRTYQAFASDPRNRPHFWSVRGEAYPLLDSLDTVAFEMSHGEAMIQAADLMASSMTALLRRLVADGWDAELGRLAVPMLGGFVIPDLAMSFFHYVGSDALMQRLAKGVARALAA